MTPNEKQRLRYATDPAYRERMLANSRANYNKVGFLRQAQKPALRDRLNGQVCSMLGSAKYRAKRDGLPFSLTHADIVIPLTCPILGIQLTRSTTGKSTSTSPSLDKVDPVLGYIPGNVRVISQQANRLKDANTIETLTALLAYCKGEI